MPNIIAYVADHLNVTTFLVIACFSLARPMQEPFLLFWFAAENR